MALQTLPEPGFYGTFLRLHASAETRKREITKRGYPRDCALNLPSRLLSRLLRWLVLKRLAIRIHRAGRLRQIGFFQHLLLFE